MLTEAERRGQAVQNRIQRGQVSRARQELVGSSPVAVEDLCILSPFSSSRIRSRTWGFARTKCDDAETFQLLGFAAAGFARSGEHARHSSLCCPQRVLPVWVTQPRHHRRGPQRHSPFDRWGSIRSRVPKFHSDEVDGGSCAPANAASCACCAFPTQPALVARRIRTPPRNPAVRRRGARDPLMPLLFGLPTRECC